MAFKLQTSNFKLLTCFYSLTTTRPRICPDRMRSIWSFSSDKSHSAIMLFRVLIFQSVARRCQIFSLRSMGHKTESMPISLTPRRINGYTVVCSSGEDTRPQQVITPWYCVVLMSVDRMFPPTVSIAAAQRPDRMGRPVSSSNVRRSMTS